MTNYRELLENEVFVYEGRVLTTQRGMAVLSGADERAVRKYIARQGLRTIEAPKPVKPLSGKGYSVRTKALLPSEVSDVLTHFALSGRVTGQVREHSIKLLSALATRGYEAWVSDMLGVKLDHTESNAAINQLLATYPSLNFFADAKPMDKVPCRVWLAELMERLESELLKLNYEQAVITELHEYLRYRLPQMAAATHKVILGYAPAATTVKVNGKEVSQYLYETDAPLKSAYIHLMAEFMFNRL